MTAKSKAKFKIGILQTDERLNDLIIKTSLKQLEQHGANVLGAVLTRVSRRDSAYGMDYYYYYGE